MQEAVIVSAIRSPMGRAHKGQFVHTRIDDIGAQLMRAAVQRAGVDPQLIDDALIGCAMPEGEQGLNVARNIVFLSGLPIAIGGVTINRFCASSLTAVCMAAQAVQSENGQVFLAGGIESMSHVPMGGFNPSLNPRLLQPGLPDAYISMGTTAENLARKYSLSRSEQDQFALASHRKAVSAMQQGKFKNEIVAIEARDAQGNVRLVDRDEGPRAETTLEKLGELKPAFEKDGTVTAGNSSPLTDGGAMTLVMSRALAKKLKLKPIARVRAMSVAGVDPATMGLGPAIAIPKVLTAAGMKLKDIDLFEINEAFAAQVLAVLREVSIDEKRLNVHGGAIALGHPLGASGARLVATILSAMEDRGAATGLVSLCVGGGQGVAAIFERI